MRDGRKAELEEHEIHLSIKVHSCMLGYLEDSIINIKFLIFSKLKFQAPLDPKDGASSVHVGTSQTASYYPYEYTFGQYPYDRYG